jgi:hypothetical protein
MPSYFRHIKNGDIYRYEGDNKFTNLRTGVSGEIRSELSAKVLGCYAEASLILSEYPVIEELINRLQLKTEIK